MATTNQQVKTAFHNQQKAHSQNLSSDGTSLWSYGWWEVARWVKGALYGEIVVRNGKSYSMTTASKHRTYVYGTLAKTETPAHQAKMEV